MIRVCLVLKEAAKLSSKVAVDFASTSHPSSEQEFLLPMSSLAFCVVSAPDFDSCNRCVVVSQCCFNFLIS